MKDNDKITVPNKFLLDQLSEYFRQGKSVAIPLKGRSMLPFIREGDNIVLKPYESEDLTKGVVLLIRIDDDLILHRVVKYNSVLITLAGDGNLSWDEVAFHHEVVATAVSIHRGTREINLNQRWRQLLGLCWYRARPFRKVLIKLGGSKSKYK